MRAKTTAVACLAFSVVEGELGLNHEVELGAALDLETDVLEVVAGEVARNDELEWSVNVDSGNLQATERRGARAERVKRGLHRTTHETDDTQRSESSMWVYA